MVLNVSKSGDLFLIIQINSWRAICWTLIQYPLPPLQPCSSSLSAWLRSVDMSFAPIRDDNNADGCVHEHGRLQPDVLLWCDGVQDGCMRWVSCITIRGKRGADTACPHCWARGRDAHNVHVIYLRFTLMWSDFWFKTTAETLTRSDITANGSALLEGDT